MIFFEFGFDLVVYQVSTFDYVLNWSKSLVLWWWVVSKATIVFISGPNLKNTTLLWPRPKLNNITLYIKLGNPSGTTINWIVLFYFNLLFSTILHSTLLYSLHCTHNKQSWSNKSSHGVVVVVTVVVWFILPIIGPLQVLQLFSTLFNSGLWQ